MGFIHFLRYLTDSKRGLRRSRNPAFHLLKYREWSQGFGSEGVMLAFMCWLDGTTGHLDIWSNVMLGVPAKMFLDEMSTYLNRRLREAGRPPSVLT